MSFGERIIIAATSCKVGTGRTGKAKNLIESVQATFLALHRDGRSSVDAVSTDRRYRAKSKIRGDLEEVVPGFQRNDDSAHPISRGP